MNGTVDSSGRALLPIRLKHPITLAESAMEVWIDTGFTGELVIPSQQIVSLGLPLGVLVHAVLADGSQVALDTYDCDLDWFGQTRRIEVVANQGRFPLLGVGLLLDRELKIDYRNKTLSLD